MIDDEQTVVRVRRWLSSDPPRSADTLVDEVLEVLGRGASPRAPRRREVVVRLPPPIAAAVAAAAIVLVVAAIALLPGDLGPGATGGATPTRSPRFTPRATADLDGAPPATRPMAVDGIRLTLDVPAGWETFGDGGVIDYISKSDRGPQGAEAQMVFAAFPSRGDGHWECHYLQAYRDRTSTDPPAAEVADVVASVPGTDLISGPTPVTVGGLEALEVVFTVRDDVGCDPGFFYIYDSTLGGALWPETAPGDTVRVWIVDLPRDRHLFVEAKSKPAAGSALLAEIQAIVDSIVVAGAGG